MNINFSIPKIYCLLSLFGFHAESIAGRSMQTYPMTVRAAQYQCSHTPDPAQSPFGTPPHTDFINLCAAATGGAGTGSQMDGNVTFTNISNYPQTLIIKILEEHFNMKAAFTTASMPSLPWTNAISTTNWYKTPEMTYSPISSHSFSPPVIAPHTSYTQKWSWYCKFSFTGGANCADSVTNADTVSVDFKNASWEQNYQFTISVEIAEDRGAVIGGGMVETVISNALNQVATPVTFSFNGGRPF